ncbi:MAG: hypothetical protein CML16_14920 [Pusillimonas sp.]|nr:hypothetical protein [Pusillimonas sp.]MBC42805.1 hypothetical protein [Pusillimonas sp.]HCP78614.1 hypothetical protein [Pusillimonas sp.]|tara:strand:+ start:20100 stop:20342 length:243 start_codon:yes stop_codon:yes gene_type:complete
MAKRKAEVDHKGSPPIPVLRHISPGQMVVLAHESKQRILIKKDRWYGHFGDMKASLCHPVNPAFMVFGEGAGWRVKETDQ